MTDKRSSLVVRGRSFSIPTRPSEEVATPDGPIV
jgi:hypothetical protein